MTDRTLAAKFFHINPKMVTMTQNTLTSARQAQSKYKERKGKGKKEVKEARGKLEFLKKIRN